ncbi:MAG: 2,3-dihydroxybiphenyl 1,2-dioxygenase [Chloroflexi bacterium]|nr:2,3-dihydroxybiphenyl 1,2-dioxygenase [Chloroflexota bacterium]
MAELVDIIGVTHNPFLPGLLKAPNAEQALLDGAADYEGLHQRLAKARPDVLICVASDHLNQWFMNNMPPFIVGKAPRAVGPFPHEERGWGLTHYDVEVDTDVAKHVLRSAPDVGIDLAFSDEFLIDHSFTVPLNFLRPEMDIPIVPIWTNVMAPPLPPARRFFQIGQALRRIIDDMPGGKRVGVVSSGHLSVEVGGPRMGGTSAPDLDFDRRVMDLMGKGDPEALLAEASAERLLKAGNVAFGFLNYVLLLGLANGEAAQTAAHFNKTTATVNYFLWDYATSAT